MSASVTRLADWLAKKGLPEFPWLRETAVAEPVVRRSDYPHQRKRKAAVRQATPRWANPTKIQGMYAKAQIMTRRTGVQHVVDHILPIQGRDVCGLHTHENMRVITQKMNGKKHNRWWDDE